MHLPGGIRMRYRPFRERGFRTAHKTGAARGAWHIYPAAAGAAGDADAAGLQHSLDVRDVQDLLQALQWEPDKASAFWPDLCDACRTLYRLSGEQLDIYVRLTQPAYAADLHLVEPDTLPPS